MRPAIGEGRSREFEIASAQNELPRPRFGDHEHVEIAAHADVTAGERPKDVHRANVRKLPGRRDKTLESALEDRSKRLG